MGRGLKAAGRRPKDPKSSKKSASCSYRGVPKSNGKFLINMVFCAKQMRGGKGPSVLRQGLALLVFIAKGAKLVISSTWRSGNFDKSVKDLPKMTPPKC